MKTHLHIISLFFIASTQFASITFRLEGIEFDATGKNIFQTLTSPDLFAQAVRHCKEDNFHECKNIEFLKRDDKKKEFITKGYYNPQQEKIYDFAFRGNDELVISTSTGIKTWNIVNDTFIFLINYPRSKDLLKKICILNDVIAFTSFSHTIYPPSNSCTQKAEICSFENNTIDITKRDKEHLESNTLVIINEKGEMLYEEKTHFTPYLVSHSEKNLLARAKSAKEVIISELDITKRSSDKNFLTEKILLKHPSKVWAAIFDKEGKYLFTISGFATLFIWDITNISSPKKIQEFKFSENSLFIENMRWNDDVLVIKDINSSIWLCRTEKGQEAQTDREPHNVTLL